ncbi:MAG: GNAT family N-acetyltransferase [Bacteroidales bacterium]|nr:GNAT family N-acetyltransferase [Bacteroidales bacterium]
MSAININVADDDDNDKIIGLAEKCPQEGMITYFINRTPRFNTLQRLLDKDAWHLIARKDDNIIGLVGVVHFPASVLDKTYKVGYMHDLRVDKAYRSGMTAFKLIRAAEDHVRKSDADMVIGNFLKDNKRPLVFTKGRVGLPSAHFLGTNRIFNIIPIRSMRLDSRYKIEKPGDKDISSIIELYRRYASRYAIAPLITEDRFRNYLENINGLSLDNFLVAKEDGKIRAVTALWDEHPYKSYQVLRLNFSIRVVTGLLNFLSHFIKVPHPVRLNEPLRQLSLVLFAHDDCPEALDTLFRHANNIGIGSEYTLIMLYAPENDPLFIPMKKFTGISVRSEMYVFARESALIEELIKNPSGVLMDITMTI